MALNGTEKLYMSSGASYAPVTVTEVSSFAGSSFVLPAPTALVRGGVLTGAGITDSTAPVTAAAPAGGTGTAAGGWDTAGNRDLAITTINQTRTLALELQTKLNALISSLETNGIIAG